MDFGEIGSRGPAATPGGRGQGRRVRPRGFGEGGAGCLARGRWRLRGGRPDRVGPRGRAVPPGGRAGGPDSGDPRRAVPGVGRSPKDWRAGASFLGDGIAGRVGGRGRSWWGSPGGLSVVTVERRAGRGGRPVAGWCVARAGGSRREGHPGRAEVPGSPGEARAVGRAQAGDPFPIVPRAAPGDRVELGPAPWGVTAGGVRARCPAPRRSPGPGPLGRSAARRGAIAGSPPPRRWAGRPSAWVAQGPAGTIDPVRDRAIPGGVPARDRRGLGLVPGGSTGDLAPGR